MSNEGKWSSYVKYLMFCVKKTVEISKFKLKVILWDEVKRHHMRKISAQRTASQNANTM